MIGSDTFIIVAFRCRESSTPFALASAICLAKKSRKARLLIVAGISTTIRSPSR